MTSNFQSLTKLGTRGNILKERWGESSWPDGKIDDSVFMRPRDTALAWNI